jgi:hypothetical protein
VEPIRRRAVKKFGRLDGQICEISCRLDGQIHEGADLGNGAI